MFTMRWAVTGGLVLSALLAGCGGGQDLPPPQTKALPVTAASVPTIYTIGDSTVANYSSSLYPRSGWGQVLRHFFDPARVAVVNRAVGGSSSKSYYDRYWASVRSLLKPGDYVTIGFGINDMYSDAGYHTDPFTSFKAYLTRYVNEVKAAGAHPIIVATQPRNTWSGSRVYPAYGNYPVASRQLAAELGVPLIDLDRNGVALMESLGQSYSTNYLFAYFLPGEWANFPNGYADGVHFQEMGAIELARMVVAGIRNLSGDPNVSRLIPSLKPTYRVTFISNNANGGQITRSQDLPAGITVTAYARPFAGYSFVSWNGDVTGTRKNTTFVMGTMPKTLIATFGGSPALYHAESAALSGSGTAVESAYAGFHGSGYVNLPVNGGTIAFYNADGGEGASRVVRIRYALGGAYTRRGQLVVNGTAYSVSFRPTGAYSTWSVLDVPVTLKSGRTNTIQLKSIGYDLANIDELTVR
jgi:lysophospholipase L1-like esterase